MTGWGKNGSGICGGAGAGAGVIVDADFDVDADDVGKALRLELEGSSLGGDTFSSKAVEVGVGLDDGVVIPKVSPAPSQSELVKSGV